MLTCMVSTTLAEILNIWLIPMIYLKYGYRHYRTLYGRGYFPFPTRSMLVGNYYLKYGLLEPLYWFSFSFPHMTYDL